MATSATARVGFGGVGVGMAQSAIGSRSWDIIATADADTTLVIAHGQTFADAVNDPLERVRVTLEPRGVKAYTQNWFVASIDATNLTLTKSSVAVGTGDAASQVRVHFEYQRGVYV